MQLCFNNLASISGKNGLSLPDEALLRLPEKILQFGTGIFLRGFIDYIIDKANKDGVFNGRVVVIKSTDIGSIDAFVRQDQLYTLVMKSVDEGITREDKVVCAAISRTLRAEQDWEEVLACAANEALKVIVSNTTETGIRLLPGESIFNRPPVSFPAKLLRFLYERFQIFDGNPGSGMIIVPTELIADNGTLLKEIIHTLALQNNLGDRFMVWLERYNDFCNSLVDRIVPGKLPAAEHLALQEKLGYEDDLMIMSETFGLWAIETSNDRTRSALSFSTAYEGVHLVDDIEKFRELKLRLLNGSHNLSCAVGYLAGFQTVKEAMADHVFDRFMQQLIQVEIANAIVSEKISLQEARSFGAQVLQRYRNPYIEFDWLSICVQDTAKIRIRAIPIILQHALKYDFVPPCICIGFAAYILFMRPAGTEAGSYIGMRDDLHYPLVDDAAPLLAEHWQKEENRKNDAGAGHSNNKYPSWTRQLVHHILSDKMLWEEDLSLVKGFVDEVSDYLSVMLEQGVTATLQSQMAASPCKSG